MKMFQLGLVLHSTNKIFSISKIALLETVVVDEASDLLNIY